MLEVNEQSDAGREPAPLRLRVAALAIDSLTVMSARTVIIFAAIDNPLIVAISNPIWQERLGGLWLADVAVSMYMEGLMTLAFRFLASLLFGTTPGRKLTGLRIVADADGLPGSRSLVAIRDLLALFLFAIPVLNAAWIVHLLLASKKLGWHERHTDTAVAQSFRIVQNRFRGGRDSRRHPLSDTRDRIATWNGAARNATERPNAGREAAPLGLRIGALAIDGWSIWTASAFMVTFLGPGSPEVSEPVDPTLIRNLLRTFAVIGVYPAVIFLLAIRFLISLLFGTTPGRKLTGLRIVTDLGGRPVGRARLAFREFLALLFFSLPIINVLWLSLIFLRSRSPGWHELLSGTTVVRAS